MFKKRITFPSLGEFHLSFPILQKHPLFLPMFILDERQYLINLEWNFLIFAFFYLI